MDRSSPNNLALLTSVAVVFLLLASCVSQKKYEQKAAALNRMDSLYFVCQSQSRQLQQQVEELEHDTAQYATEVRELISRYNKVSESSSSEIKKLQKENEALRQKLAGYRITLSKYTIDWRNLKKDLMDADSVLSVLSYRMDTLLSHTSLPYQILREPSRLVLNLPENHLFNRYGRIQPPADSAINKLNELVSEYPGLQVSTGTHDQKDLNKLIRLTGQIRLDSVMAPIDFYIGPAVMEDNYSVFFTLPSKRGITGKE